VIEYRTSLKNITGADLDGFFEGWPSPPSPEMHLRLLEQSDCIVLATEVASGRVVGFITAVTDHVLSAYIPLLEVLPEYRKQGIGKMLVNRMIEQLNGIYMIDLTCDTDVQPFYKSAGMQPMSGMMIRNFDYQSGQAT
jgi:ribosomal protein S18 acetylase RimI-like enzyme